MRGDQGSQFERETFFIVLFALKTLNMYLLYIWLHQWHFSFLRLQNTQIFLIFPKVRLKEIKDHSLRKKKFSIIVCNRNSRQINVCLPYKKFSTAQPKVFFFSLDPKILQSISFFASAGLRKIKDHSLGTKDF